MGFHGVETFALHDIYHLIFTNGKIHGHLHLCTLALELGSLRAAPPSDLD